MSGRPQALTPAKNPADQHSVRRHLPVHHGPAGSSSPCIHARVNPSTPPESAKKNRAPHTTSINKQLRHANASVDVAEPAIEEKHNPNRRASLPPPSRPLQGSGRRHTDTEGVLTFPNERDGAVAAAAETVIPLRPPQQSTGTVSTNAAAPDAAQLSLSNTLAPSAAVAVEAADVNDKCSNSHADIALLLSLNAGKPCAVVDTSTDFSKGNEWSSLKKPERAVSLISPTCALPQDAGDKATDIVRDVQHAAQEAQREDKDTGVGSDIGTDVVCHGDVGDASTDHNAAPYTTDTGVYSTGETGHTPTPLPVTPVRPARVRYFRCAMPLLYVGREREGSDTSTSVDIAVTPASAGSAVVVSGQSTKTDERGVDEAETASEASDTSCLCGNVPHEDPYTVTSPLPASTENVEEYQEEEEIEAIEHAPRVLDMNTTVLSGDDDYDKDADEVDQPKGSEGSRTECSFFHSVADAAADNAAFTAARFAEVSREKKVAMEGAQHVTLAKASQARGEEYAPLPETVLPRSNANSADVEPNYPFSLQGFMREASALLLSDSDAEPVAEEEIHNDDELQIHTTLASSTNTSFADSRAYSDADCSESDNIVEGLHRVAIAAPATIRSPSPGISDKDSHDSRSNSNNYQHNDRHTSLPSLSSRSTLGVELEHGATSALSSTASPSLARREGADDVAKRISLSSGRGLSSSYGCTECMNSPASHQTRRSTPRIENENEGGGNAEASGRRSTSPVVVAPTSEIVFTKATDPADVVFENFSAERNREVLVVPLKDVHLRIIKSKTLASNNSNDEEGVETRTTAAEHRMDLQRTHGNERCRIWHAKLTSLATLVEEYQLDLLATVMKELKEAWLPAAPTTGLHHVNKAALLTPPYVRPQMRTQPWTALTPIYSTQKPPSLSFASSFSKFGEVVVDYHCVQVSELHLLFCLFASAPSARGQKRLVNVYFGRQLQRYVNWVHHFEFEFLYVRMVAARAMQMLEMHERRLTCVRRDLGIRDKIELFVLLTPRPRAPTVSAGRGIFSAFRMALHALGGGDSQRDSRNKSNSNAGNGNSSRGEKRGAGSHLTPPPLSPTDTLPGRPPMQMKKKGDAAAAKEAPIGSNLEHLLTSERCGSGKYAVPVVIELPRRPTETNDPRALLNSKSREARTRRQEAEAASTAEETQGEKDAAIPTVREIVDNANPPRESADHHRGTPRPLNKTYANYYKLLTEKKKHNPSLFFTDFHLPQLRRTASRVPSAASCRASTDKNEDGEHSKRSVGKDAYEEKVSKFGLQLSGRKSSGSPKRRKDKVLRDGRLRARERVPPQQRTRTPPPPPTETEFVDLRDENVLRRFVM